VGLFDDSIAVPEIDKLFPGSNKRAFACHRAVMNDLDRFHLVLDVIDRVPTLRSRATYAKQAIRDKLTEHKQYIRAHGQDMPEVRDWRWPGRKGN